VGGVDGVFKLCWDVKGLCCSVVMGLWWMFCVLGVVGWCGLWVCGLCVLGWCVFGEWLVLVFGVCVCFLYVFGVCVLCVGGVWCGLVRGVWWVVWLVCG
jgi:hypothetical protein